MTFGLTPQGLIIMQLADVQAQDIENFQAQFGKGVDVSTPSPFGNIIGIDANNKANLWLLLQAVYNSSYRGTASGISLDWVGDLTGCRRLPATPSVIGSLASPQVLVQGTPGTVIPANTFRASVANNPAAIFQNTAAGTITGPGLNEQQKVTFTAVPTLGTWEIQFVSQVTVPLAYNCVAADVQTALQNLANIGAGNVTVAGNFVAGFTITFTGTLANANQPMVTITANSLTFGGNAVGTGITEVVYGTGPFVALPFQCTTNGPVAANAQSLTNIVTPLGGVSSVINLVNAVPGQNVETDAAYKVRQELTLQKEGTSPVEGIRNGLLNQQNCPGVTQAVVLENATDAVVSGMPPHSIQAIVTGGAAADIAMQIWKSKAAGVATFGSQTYTITDSMGVAHVINWNTPTPVRIYTICNITKNTNPTEGPVYPADGDAQVQAAIYNFGTSLGEGHDVINNLFFTAVNAVPGVFGIVLYMATTPAPASSANIPITISQIATFALADITVNS